VDLIILTDGSRELGFGHISRSQTLADFLIENGYKVEVVILSTVNLETLVIDSNVIIDIPYNGDFLFNKISTDYKVLGLDYLGSARLDLVINVFDYSRYKNNNQISGLEYVIIRRNVAKLIGKSYEDSETVLIMLGAFDLNNFAHGVIQSLDNKKIRTTVIEKEKSVMTKDFNYCTHYEDPDDIAEIMCNSSWAISNGGSSMLELMALGKAIYVLPQSDAEDKLALQIFKEGGILGIGLPIKVPSVELINAVGNKARKMIDGLGVQRIMRHIEVSLK
jgi:spore coat polysaccharide biosynthesis predicted glycosyltransferase SpsG